MRDNSKIPHIKSVETRHLEERDTPVPRTAESRPAQLYQGFDRRRGRRLAAAASNHFHSFLPINVAYARRRPRQARDFRFAYISDSHLYAKKTNERFVRQLLRAVDDVNKLDPQPDFVFYGGDLAQLGRKEELDLGAQILKSIKAPLHMMVGEHDWFFDMGQHWNELFGPQNYSFDHKGVHFVVLMSVQEKDFWTAARHERRRSACIPWPDSTMPCKAPSRSARPQRDVAEEGPGEGAHLDAPDRVLALAALQAVPPVELLDRRCRGCAGHPAAL